MSALVKCVYIAMLKWRPEVHDDGGGSGQVCDYTCVCVLKFTLV